MKTLKCLISVLTVSLLTIGLANAGDAAGQEEKSPKNPLEGDGQQDSTSKLQPRLRQS